MFDRKAVWIGALLLAAILNAGAAERAPGKAGIASAHPLATEAGHAILAQGGNAFDAAVAVAAALAVVEPNGSGIGGGGFILLHRASDGLNVMIDAREKAPYAATRDMYLDVQGNPVPELSLAGALAAAIPGEPAGMAHLAAKYGRLPLKTSLQPAIRLARDGFPVYPRLRAAIEDKQDTFKQSRETARVFLKNGAVPPLGFIVKQPDLARTLELMANKGVDAAFYHGALARKLVAGTRKAGGIWTEKDLADYRTVERAPIIGTYRGARIVSASPPASGGIALLDALNILEAYDLSALDSATRKHVIVEAMRRMHRDRASYLGDPDFVQIPVERLTHKYYAEGQRTSLRLDRATPSEMLPSDAISASRGSQTTHFSILDRDGNRVAVTFTLNTGFGTGVIVAGTGILLNNEMDDFSVKPGAPNVYRLIGAEANSIVPGKRPLSSSAPTFVETEDRLMIVGSPGGSYIIGIVLLATLEFLDGKSAADIVGAPRFHHQYYPDVISYEPDALSESERVELTKRGHKLREGGPWGNMQAVTWDYASGEVEAAADPRGNGAGVVR